MQEKIRIELAICDLVTTKFEIRIDEGTASCNSGDLEQWQINLFARLMTQHALANGCSGCTGCVVHEKGLDLLLSPSFSGVQSLWFFGTLPGPSELHCVLVVL